MGKAILKTNLKREPSKLYYLKDSSDGFLVIYEAVMARAGRKSKNKKTTKKK